MKFFAINGSPRKNCNTVQLLDKSLEGIKSVFPDASTERIDLYDFPFHGCMSCFACKRINGRHYGRCVQKDDLKPILDEIVQADGIILGSPIYFSDVSGNMRCFLERFMFPFVAYSKTESVEHKKMPLACIYTMNASEELSHQIGYHNLHDHFEMGMSMVFAKPEHLYVYETYQFKDYSKYVSDVFDEKERKHIRKTRFPKDLENAFDIGRNVAIQAKQHD
ncbi:flavodoxin family protein [Methanobrevibacter sp.]|uniref:flavodoxin family protein n=1 Tax=Methanobrevibacter sp. TaxID=66852 RepID=UPI00386647B7